MNEPRFTPEEFERACSLLPEGTMWGEHLSVEIVLHIAQASRRAALEEAAAHFDGIAKKQNHLPITPEFAARQVRAIVDGDTHG